MSRATLVGIVALVAGCASKGAPGDREGTVWVGETTDGQAKRVRHRRLPEHPARVREGSAIALSAAGDAVYVADEDHARLRIVPLPLDGGGSELDLGGRPASIVVLAERVLVTLRDPGALVVLRPDGDGLVEQGRVSVPDDAWGLAVTPDEGLALVTSAWTAKVSAVDLDAQAVLWSVGVAREPRGVVVRADGTVYVTHLVGADVSRIDDLDAGPRVSRVHLPAAPLRTAPEMAGAASLGYTAVLSPDGRRLYAPRRALGAAGHQVWAGVGTVDVLHTTEDEPLLVPSTTRTVKSLYPAGRPMQPDHTGAAAYPGAGPFVQPRAAVYRKRTDTLVLACEGSDALVELDALAAAPSFRSLQRYRFSRPEQALSDQSRCGAPSGIALSADESIAYVLCRTTDTVAEVALADEPGKMDENKRAADTFSEPLVTVRTATLVARPSAQDLTARGRRLYYNALDANMSDGIACAGCHPDGRDDGHVWHDLGNEGSDFEKRPFGDGTASDLGASRFRQGFIGAPIPALLEVKHIRGRPRQTPMLAGRVSFDGPFGWRGMQKNLEARVTEGFDKHRWFFADQGWGDFVVNLGDGRAPRAKALAAFLRDGLVPPPKRERALSDVEEQGRRIFMDERTACASCHTPSQGYTNLTPVMLGDGQVQEDDTFSRGEPQQFRTPSLLYVAGTAPYFHDGHAATLGDLIAENGDRMGWTSHLSDDERAALVAYLETL